MGKAIITVGAKTNHGGKVITGSMASLIEGKPMARIGDKVLCPWHGLTTILTGDTTFIVDGKPVARQGDLTSCGAKLIPSQLFCTVDSASSSVETVQAMEPQDLSDDFEVNKEEPHESDDDIHKCRVRFVDEEGAPHSNRDYIAVLLHDKEKLVTGTTDAEGYTEYVESDKPDSVLFHLIEPVQESFSSKVRFVNDDNIPYAMHPYIVICRETNELHEDTTDANGYTKEFITEKETDLIFHLVI